MSQEINDTCDYCEVHKSYKTQETQKIERFTVLLYEVTQVIKELLKKRFFNRTAWKLGNEFQVVSLGELSSILVWGFTVIQLPESHLCSCKGL